MLHSLQEAHDSVGAMADDNPEWFSKMPVEFVLCFLYGGKYRSNRSRRKGWEVPLKMLPEWARVCAAWEEMDYTV